MVGIVRRRSVAILGYCGYWIGTATLLIRTVLDSSSLSARHTASQRTAVNVTGATLDIHYPDGSAYGWLGPTPRPYSGWQSVSANTGDQFTATISLYSTSSSSEQILSIATSTPGFSIISVSPNTPITFDPYATVDITVTIATPGSGYDGPIDFEITAS